MFLTEQSVLQLSLIKLTAMVKTPTGSGRYRSVLPSWDNFKCTRLLKIPPSPYLSYMGEYSIGQALKYFLDKSKLKNNVRAFEITAIWEKIMGKTIAKYTEKIQIINRTLFITTPVAPLKNELLFQKEKIIQRVNEAFGENIISDVVIQ